LAFQFLKVIVKEVVSGLSLFPNEDVLTKETELWTCFVDRLSSKEDRELFMCMLNDCYKYAAAINAKGEPFPAEPLIMALLLSQHKMIDWLTKQISKYESLVNNNSNNKEEVKKAKQLGEQDLSRENTMITSERMKEFMILMAIKLVHYYYHHHKIQSSGPVYFFFSFELTYYYYWYSYPKDMMSLVNN
jgi:hypothetical protein